jgi:predicted nucleotidyltransferase
MVQNVGKIVLPRLIATAVSIFLVAWAVTGLMSLSASKTVRSLAAAIDAGGQPRMEVLERISNDQSANRLGERCDTVTLNALVTIGLAEVDLATVTADPIRGDRASEGAEAAIRKALRCAPLDGNLWLRLAALDTVRRGPSVRTVEFIRLSHWIAPNEGWIVRRRVDLASRLFGSGVRDVQPELRSDIRTLVNLDGPSKVADMFFTAPESVRPIYREWIDLLPEERKNKVTKAVERSGTSLNGT